MIKKVMSFSLIIWCLLLSLIVPSFAYGGIDNKYGVLEKEEVQDYIDNFNSSETIDILGVMVTYYYGDDYTVVDDPGNGYFLITYDEGDIFVNNKMVEYREVVVENDESYSTLAIGDWTHFKTTEREYNVVGLVPSAIGGIIGGAVAGKITSVLLGTFAGVLIGGRFPEYYVSVRHVEEFRIIDIWNDVVEWRGEYDLYHGTKYDRWGNYWFGFTTP